MVPGTAFGSVGEGYCRASYCATMPDLEKAVERIGKFLRGLNQ
jgi:aminotransferase